MKRKSLKLNAILNFLKTGISVVFLLITFPYASRILDVENLGKINFSSSVISYFLLLSTLGISSYAIREGAGIREDKTKITKFANEMFSINLISTIISYIVLFISIVFIPKLEPYKELLMIQGIAIIFTTIGVDWMNSIYEDYFYMTFRTVLFQFLSLILLLTLVHHKDDYYIYAFITVISSVGANILNFIYSRKYCKFKFTRRLNLAKHLKPILIIFSTSIASIIYTSSDLTMLGLMVNNYSVGIYSVSVKIYTIIKQLLFAITIVSLPRLSFYLSNNNKEEYSRTLSKITNCISLVIIPIVVGINLLSKEIVLIVSGKSYIEASVSLQILSLALIFAAFGYLIMQCVLLPMKKEKYILMATVISALVNIGLNFIFIPLFSQNGAAVSTVIAEFLVLAISYFFGRKDFKLKKISRNFLDSIIGSLVLIIAVVIIKRIISNMILSTIISVLVGMIIYAIVLLILKNQLAYELIAEFSKKVKCISIKK